MSFRDFLVAIGGRYSFDTTYTPSDPTLPSYECATGKHGECLGCNCGECARRHNTAAEHLTQIRREFRQGPCQVCGDLHGHYDPSHPGWNNRSRAKS